MWFVIFVVVVVDYFAIRHILGKDKKKRPDPAPEEYLHRDEEELPPLNLAATDVFKRNTNPKSVLDRMPVTEPPRPRNDWVLKDCTYIDTETTGLHPEDGKILEIAAVKVRDNQVIDTYQQLINPQMHIPAAASKVNGITDDMVKDCPTFEQIELDFLRFIGGDILVGHNIKFDIDFIEHEIGETLDNFTYNSIALARSLLKMESYRLKDLCSYLGISDTQDHRALSDAMLTYGLIQELKRNATRRNLTLGFEFPKTLSKKHYKFAVRDLSPRKDPDPTSVFYGKHVVFTGTLPVPRKMAMQAVLDLGGQVGSNVIKKTRILVKGKEEGVAKIEKAKEAKEAGQDITIMSAEEFIEEIERG